MGANGRRCPALQADGYDRDGLEGARVRGSGGMDASALIRLPVRTYSDRQQIEGYRRMTVIVHVVPVRE